MARRDAGSDSDNDDDETKRHEEVLKAAAKVDFQSISSVRAFRKEWEKEKGFTDGLPNSQTLLHTMASKELTKETTQLLDWLLKNFSGFLTTPNAEMENPLHIAIKNKKNEFLEYVLDSRAIITQALEMTDQENKNCLHWAIYRQTRCTERLIEQFSVEAVEAFKKTNALGDTPLHAAMRVKQKNKPQSKPGENQDDPRLRNFAVMNPLMGELPPTPKSSSLNKQDAAGRRGSLTVHPKGDYAFPASKAKNKFHLLDVVDRLIEHWPDALTVANNAGESPYQVQRRLFQDSASQDEVEKHIKDVILEKFGSSIRDVRKALYGRNDSNTELCLDMSDFNQSSHDFSRFVQHLNVDPSPHDLPFEKTLLYVYLPDFNTFRKDCPHDGLRTFFRWLNETKEVAAIKDLSIPDSINNPISDELIEKAVLHKFKIEKFNWRKLDISLDILTNSPYASEFKDLRLYSSGNWSTLYHWASNDGLRSPLLSKLESVTIEIMGLGHLHDKEATSRHKERAYKYKTDFEAIFKPERPIKLNFVPEGEWDFPLVRDSGGDAPPLPDLKIFRNFVNCHRFLNKLDDQVKLYVQAKIHDPANEIYCSPLATRFGESLVKIAIIDNGVDRIQTTLKDNIEKGISFVTADSETKRRILPWWMVADPHGTQMASLIQKVNPYCRLYIARVGKGRKDIKARNAAKAVQWAIEQEVDIISISWITKRKSTNLEAAIKDAVEGTGRDSKKSPTLVFCSTADEGVASDEIYPANYPGTIKVSASDKYGNRRPASDRGVDVLLPGEDISADGPIYMEEYKAGPVTGSSVATALAAGIASLAILLIRTSNEDEHTLKHFLTREKIMQVFAKMSDGRNGIQVSKLFSEGFDTTESNLLKPAWVDNFKDLKTEVTRDDDSNSEDDD